MTKDKTRLTLFITKNEVKKLKKRAIDAGKSLSNYLVSCSDQAEKKK